MYIWGHLISFFYQVLKTRLIKGYSFMTETIKFRFASNELH